MPDLTPLEAAEKLENTAKWLDDKEDFGCGQDAMLFAASYLRKIASGEHAPVVHAHWIFGSTQGHSWMKCSNCLVSQSGQTATFTYCPSCGARMDEIPDMGILQDGKDDSHV